MSRLKLYLFISLLLFEILWVDCAKRKESPTNVNSGYNKKTFQRSQSLPKQSIKDIFHETDMEEKRLHNIHLKTSKQVEKKLNQIERRKIPGSYAPLGAINRDELIKHFEESKDRNGDAKSWKGAAQAILYRSKQLERLNKERQKINQSPLKSIPTKIRNLEALSGLMMDQSNKHQQSSNDSLQKYTDSWKTYQASKIGKWPEPVGYCDRCETHYKQDSEEWYTNSKQALNTFDNHQNYLEKNKKYFELSRQPRKKRAKTIG